MNRRCSTLDKKAWQQSGGALQQFGSVGGGLRGIGSRAVSGYPLDRVRDGAHQIERIATGWRLGSVAHLDIGRPAALNCTG